VDRADLNDVAINRLKTFSYSEGFLPSRHPHGSTTGMTESIRIVDAFEEEVNCQ